jgi:hypothetical protein
VPTLEQVIFFASLTLHTSQSCETSSHFFVVSVGLEFGEALVGLDREIVREGG